MKFTNAQVKKLIKLGEEEYDYNNPFPSRTLDDTCAQRLASSLELPAFKVKKASWYVKLGYNTQRDKTALARLIESHKHFVVNRKPLSPARKGDL